MTHDPYGSHVPFLTWIGEHTHPIRWVLELGAGRYSTPLWLGRSVFPQMERVVTIEDHKEWVPALTDHRLQVVVTDVCLYAEALHNVDPFDLVFIDNGACEQDRIRVIKAVLALPRLPLVVVHDWENASYRQVASGGYDWVFTDDARPQTALLMRRSQ